MTDAVRQGSPLDYANLRIGLRAPRVAVVFDGGPDWKYWARVAIHDIAGYWGGAGFILVPP